MDAFSAPLYFLFNHDHVAKYSSNSIFKFAGDTTILVLSQTKIRLPTKIRSVLSYQCNPETANFFLDFSKTKEKIVNYRRVQDDGYTSL